jgi:hypothetical protein
MDRPVGPHGKLRHHAAIRPKVGVEIWNIRTLGCPDAACCQRGSVHYEFHSCTLERCQYLLHPWGGANPLWHAPDCAFEATSVRAVRLHWTMCNFVGLCM